MSRFFVECCSMPIDCVFEIGAAMTLRISLASILILTLFNLSVNAQDDPARTSDRASRQAELEKQERARFEFRFKREHQRLLAMLENVDRTCQLSDDQKATLKETSLEVLKLTMATAARRAEFNARPATERMVKRGPAAPISLSRHPNWLKAIEQTLTEKQRDLYQKERERRQSVRQSAAVLFSLELIDHQTALTKSQREQMQKLIRETLAAEPAEIPDEWNAFIYSHAHLLPTLYGVPPERLKKILGEEQMKAWNVFMLSLIHI